MGTPSRHPHHLGALRRRCAMGAKPLFRQALVRESVQDASVAVNDEQARSANESLQRADAEVEAESTERWHAMSALAA